MNDQVTLSEFADMYGIKLISLERYATQGRIPEPDGPDSKKGNRLWLRKTAEAYAGRHEKLRPAIKRVDRTTWCVDCHHATIACQCK
jgi:hypothetical protein